MELIEINSCLGIAIGQHKLLLHSHKAPCIEAICRQGHTLKRIPLSLYTVTESSENDIKLRFSGIMCLCDVELIQEEDRITINYSANAEQLVISLSIPKDILLYFDNYAVNGRCFYKVKNAKLIKFKSFLNKINNNGSDKVFLEKLPNEIMASNEMKYVFDSEPLAIDSEYDKNLSIRANKGKGYIIIELSK